MKGISRDVEIENSLPIIYKQNTYNNILAKNNENEEITIKFLKNNRKKSYVRQYCNARL